MSGVLHGEITLGEKQDKHQGNYITCVIWLACSDE